MPDKRPDESIPWQAELIRVTAFGTQSLDLTATESLWKDMFSAEPSDSTHNRALGQLVVSGNYKDCSAAIIIQAGSLFQLQLTPLPSPTFDALGAVGEWTTAIGLVNEPIKQWLKNANQIKRLAVGAVLHHEVADRSAGYLELKRLLPFVQVDPESRDLLFQVNRPRPSNSGVAFTNRLSTWQVIQAMVTLQPTGGHAQPTKTLSATRLVLDVNTPAESEGIIDTKSIPTLLSELIEMAQEISTKGDCK